MEPKEQFQKILDWLRQLGRSVATVQDGQEKLSHQIQSLERKFNTRIDLLDERFDAFSEALQAMLKALRNVRMKFVL